MGISRHDILFGSFEFRFEECDPDQYILTRKINSINKNLFNHAYQLNWDVIYSMTDVNDQATFFENSIKFLLDTYAPLVRVKVSNNDSQRFRFSNEIICLENNRNYYANLWRQTRSNVNHKLYKCARNKYNKQFANEKAEFEAKSFDPKLPPKVLFKKLRDINVISSRKNVESDMSADDFNNFFASYFRNSDLTDISQASDLSADTQTSIEDFSFTNVQQDEVSKAVHSIKSNACGLDLIPLNFIKILLPIIIPFLTFLINPSITKSTYPNAWKTSKIYNTYIIHNIISCIGKIMGVLLKNQIVSYIDNMDLLTEFQSGFRSRHSTTSALLNITDDLTANLDRNEDSIMVLLDFSKAFDVIPHQKLLNKLKFFYNFSSSSLSLMRSFLSDRFQKVFHNGVLSNPVPITFH
jgi:hypothetical protein